MPSYMFDTKLFNARPIIGAYTSATKDLGSYKEQDNSKLAGTLNPCDIRARIMPC